MSTLLSNLPVKDLTPENDYLNVIERGDMITSFLRSNKEDFNEIKMFALYGEWGSGKSTLMKYLEKELKSDFNTFFFEAWEFESDDNLSNSLLEFLIDESESLPEEVSGEILDTAERLFTGFAKSIKISFPGVSISGKDLVEELKAKKPDSFLKLKKKFKTEFGRWEGFITKGEKPKYNIVFIDDLDRCEPENVLNLLSALKLFFTYGEKTIFFCGVDKKAVSQAVQTRYSDIVKSGEYLEKVFDISFKMSEAVNIRKLINYYFSSEKKYTYQKKEQEIHEIVSEFFYALGFINPRKIKKLLNKFLVFRGLCHSLPEDHMYKEITPKIFENEVVFFDIIFTLYFLILVEFYPEKFKNIKK